MLALASVALAVPVVRAQTPPVGSVDSAAVTAARAWLALADAGKYEATWDSSAALFRQALTKTQWVAAVTMEPRISTVESA